MTPEEHAAWLGGVRQWARERGERGDEERAPLYVAFGDEVRDSAAGTSIFVPRGLIATWGSSWTVTIPEWCSKHTAAEEAARLRLALVRDDTSPDGWRLVDLEVTP